VSCASAFVVAGAFVTCLGSRSRGGLTLEGLRPTFWRERTDEMLRMRRDSQEDAVHVVGWRDVDHRAALDERIEEGRAGAPSKLPAKSQFFRPTATARS